MGEGIKGYRRSLMVKKLFKAAPQTPRRGAQKLKREYYKSPIGGFRGLKFMVKITLQRIKLALMESRGEGTQGAATHFVCVIKVCE
jgi:hypothetical protein